MIPRILLLEDSDIDAELITIHLERAGLAQRITRAVGRADFEAALQPGRLDLILADYSLPDFDGLAALQMARERLPGVPFLFVSGVVGEDFAIDALRRGATDYVLKRALSRLAPAVQRTLAEARERAQRRDAEAALKTSEVNMRLAIEAAELGMWHYLAADDLMQWDGRCAQTLGLEQPVGRGFDSLLQRVEPNDRFTVADALRQAMDPAGGGQLLQECRTLDASGTQRWIVMRGQAFFEHGACTRMLGVLQDISAQKAAAARQREVEVLFRLAAEAAEVGVWDLDLVRNRLWFDDGVRAMADLPPGELRDYRQMLEGVIHPDDRERVHQALEAAVGEGGRPDVNYEHRMVGVRDRRVRWIAIQGRRMVGSDGVPRLVGTARDITEQRRLDEAVRQANRDLEERVAQRTRERDRIWNLSVDLMHVCRPDGTFVTANPAWERQLGWTAEQLQEASFLALVHPDDVALTREQMQRLEQGGETLRFDNRVLRRDGAYRWVRWMASPDSGQFYAIGRDVTDERLAADELAATNRELKTQIEERNRVEATLQQMQRLEAVGQLTSGVAHDFNNLLTVVLSNISLIQRLQQQQPMPPDERITARLESMRKASLRGAKLTAQLLAFSRRQRLETQQVDFNDVVSGMRDLLQTTLGGSVSLGAELAPGLWPALVDPTQLELIILNLAINARDAMAVGGSLTVRTANRVLRALPTRPEEPEPGEYVVLTVTDTGSGMDDTVLAKAFEPFFTTKEVGKGSGLGLAQVYGFAKQSGGGVRIETRLGHGTAVHVYMPRALPSSTAAVAEPALLPVKAPAPAGGGHTLLVVDDDEAVREVTVATLQTHGYRVLEAASGPSALATVARHREVDLVLADFAMPGMNGAELAQALKVTRPGLPVLFMTGFADLAALKDVHEDFVLQKPLPEGELAKRLQRLLSLA